MGEAERRDAVSVRGQCAEGARGTVERGLPRASGRGGAGDGRHAVGVWSHGEEYGRGEAVGPHGRDVFPPGGRGRVFEGGG